MSNKLKLILETLNETIIESTKTKDNWTDFLKTAANNYKYSFKDQVLIYAQKPYATACAEIGVWNNQFDRWVNRGVKGIALVTTINNYPRLFYVFDVSDTNSRYDADFSLWEVKSHYEQEISDALSNAFGEVAEGSLTSVIDDTARNMVEDNTIDYVSEVVKIKKGSFLEELDEHNISVILKNALASSIGYMMMVRCGIDADSYYDFEDFKDIFNFNTYETIVALGSATSDIAEMGLREIESTVKSIQKSERKANRTFVNSLDEEYDKGAKNKINTERGTDYERNHLQTGGRLFDSQSDLAERGKEALGQVRYNEDELPEESQKSVLRHSSDQGRADETHLRNPGNSIADDGAADRTDDEISGSDRGTQGEQSVALGADDEQYKTLGRGNSSEGSGLQLSNHDFDARGSNIKYFFKDKEKSELINSYLAPYKEEITAFFESHTGREERGDFLKSYFNSKPYESVLSNGDLAGFDAYSDSLRFWRGDSKEPEQQSWEKWFSISDYVYGLILMEEWTEPQAMLLPSVDKQLEFIGNKVKAAPLHLPQGAIDYILGAGSRFSEGKMRVYRQFAESLSKEDNIKFLKNEYGVGGGTSVIPGTGFWENHDAKGIEISDHYSVPERRTLLKWSYVEKRISELIRFDRYLNPKEKEMYPKWLADKTLKEIERRRENDIRELIRDAPGETTAPKEYRYEYKLSDTVYIGADEYTILSLEDPVVLSDSKFPLFTKEFSKSDFEAKVKENPANSHLKVEIEVKRPVSTGEAEVEVDESNKPDFLIQYEQVKKENPDGVLLMHVGPFYFAFGKDAETLGKHTIYSEQRKNLYGNVFTPCSQLLDFNLSYCAKELNKNNIGVVVMTIDKGVIDRYLSPSLSLPNEKDNNLTPLYRSYLKIKEEHPDTIVLYQVGDFFEAYNSDAEKVAEALDLMLTSRPIGNDERAPLVGLPKHALETYINLLNDRGFDVTVSSLENGERNTATMVSIHKEEPKETTPVGRIDYFDADGKRSDTIEYTNADSFEKDIKADTKAGETMFIAVYMDKDGKTIPIEFLNELNPPQRFATVPSPYLSKDLFEKLADFYEDIDFFDFRDSLEAGESKEDLAEKFASDLQTPEDIDKAIKDLEEIKSEYGTDEKDINLANVLIKALQDEKARITPLSDADLIGKEVIIDGDKYIIEKIDPVFGDVSMRDTSSFYPINRVEKINFVREHLAEPIKSYATEKVEEISGEKSGLPFDVVIQTIKTEEADLTPSWEKKEEPKPKLLKPDVPESQKHNFVIIDDNLGVGGLKAKFRANMDAINLLHNLEFENRLAAPEEQEILSKYVGFGGLADAFDESKENWADEFKELIVTLSPEEYDAARESTLTAFYTPSVVIRSMYEALTNMGFKTGNILEPSCGVGNFMGLLPESMKDSKFYGVELDSITGRIAQQLYQKANIVVQGYEKTDLPDSFFDIAIGNVPFGQFGVSDRKYNKHNWLIHDYFFGKTLDKVRPGGVIAFITSSGTLDKRNSNVRKYIAQRADFLGAIRLPNNTFKANAGTEVTSDIIFLQKRDTLVTEEPDWVHLDRDENGNEYNKYFVDHPEMVLGEMVMESSQFGQSLTCKPYEDRELSDLLSEAVQNIHAEITEVEIQEAGEAVDNSIPADPNVRNFSFTVVDGQVYYRENSRMNAVEVSATAENRIKGMVEIRDSVRELIQLQTEDYPDSAIQSAQDKLNEVYGRFTKKYGLINSRANRLVFSDDSSYYLLCSLEVIGENGELKRKADMFTKRTIKPHIKVTSVETASEALAVSIGDKARVDMPYMCSLSGKTEEELFEELKGAIFLNPLHTHEHDGQDKYLTADECLSGNVREKLALAKRSAELYPEDYNINVEYLEKVQPKDLDASEISVRLGATWIPTDDVQDFIFETLRTPRYCQYNMKVNFSPITGEWAIKGKSYDRMNVMSESTYGTPRINAYKIIEDTLNLKDVRIFDYVEDEYGNRKPVLNKKETAIAQGKQEMIKQAFQDWIWKDPERRERLCRMYNDTFNSMRAREYDGSHITFSGMNPEIKLREHQVNAVARIIYGGNSLLAHVVGAGKTFTMVAAAQESKRLGLCNKSLIVVPNHLTEQWATEYLQLYPSANILVATKKDFETKNRKKFCARIATGDYDAVIIGHSQFEKIPISIERQKYMLEQQIDEITLGIEQAKYDRGEKFTIKQLEKTKKSLEVKLDKLNDQSRKDDVINFEELGIDRLFVDEAHSFKNLFLYTKMRNVGGISQTEAQKSSDLYMKCRYLDEVTGNKGVVFATGTPVSNSMVELYTMQRYLQYDALSDKKLQHFDSWASTFGETVTAIELAPEGMGYRAKTRFAKFYNLPELMMMFKQVADIQTADMLNLPVPKANYQNIAVKPTDIQKEIVASLSERAEKVRNKMVDSSQDNMLLITNDGRKLALDQRLTNEMLPDEPDSKVSVCADNVFKIWEKTAEQKSTQLIFCDLSTPHNDGKFNVYDDIKKKLIAKGVPENEIAFIHNADTEAKKKELFSKVREGQIRVLIGSTAKMGAGTNVQKKLIAIHHTDCPWRPADLQQREGRIIRQGNENPEVEIYSYVTEETFDAYLYQLVENKQKFIGQIMTSKSPVRSAEDVDEQALSYAEIKALATGNPYIKEKMDLDIEVSKLKLLYQSHLSQRYALEDKLIKKFPTDIKTYEILVESYENDIQLAKDNTFPVEDGISTMVIEGVAHNDKKAAGSAILELCHAMTSPEKKYIGTYRGFNMYLSFNSFEKEYNVTLEGALQHSISVGADIQGNITRLDNLISRLPDRLEACKEKLAETEKQIENAKAEIARPFPKEQELKEKSERLAELNALLDMDHKDNEIVDGETLDQKESRETTKEIGRT